MYTVKCATSGNNTEIALINAKSRSVSTTEGVVDGERIFFKQDNAQIKFGSFSCLKYAYATMNVLPAVPKVEHFVKGEV